MKVLVFGPSGSGKTYVSRALQQAGINAFDDSDIKGLSSWYSPQGAKVVAPQTADEAFAKGYSFLWDKKALERFVNQFTDVYVFGGSGNMTQVFDLFDKLYCLKISPQLQKERLTNGTRETPQMDSNKDGLVIWGDWLEELAKRNNIPFVDAALTPLEIYAIISQ